MKPDRVLRASFDWNAEKNRARVVWLVGRIFNCGESSDVEAIEAAWERLGPDCASNLQGEFAFVIADPVRRRFFAFRDPSGSIPLYYTADSKRLAVASRLGELVDHPDLGPFDFDDLGVAIFIRQLATDRESTPFAGVRRLPPGRRIEVTESGAKISEWWRPEDHCRQLPAPEDILEAFSDILARVVADMAGESRDGFHLTGGLDSAVVGALLRQTVGDVPGFAWQPPPEPGARVGTDHEGILAFAKQESLDPVYCPPNAADIVELLSRDGAREPITLVMLLETTLQKEAARQGVESLFSGHGGDPFASHYGQPAYRELALQGRWLKLGALGKKRGFRPARFVARQLQKAISGSWADSQLGRRLARSQAIPDHKLPYLNPEFIEDCRLPKPPEPPRRTSVRRCQIDNFRYPPLVERIESQSDAGARHGLSYHYPLLDRRVLEFVLGLSGDAFIDRGLMRRTAEPLVPKSIATGAKDEAPELDRVHLTAVREAFAEIGHELRTRRTQPSRAGYIDMPRLLCDLEPESLANRIFIRKIFLALRFLDW